MWNLASKGTIARPAFAGIILEEGPEVLITILDLLEMLRIFELWDVWKDARNATEGTRLYRWRYVVQGLVLLIVIPVVLLLPLWVVFLFFKA